MPFPQAMALFRRLAAARSGSVAMLAAIALPVLAVVALGAVDVASVMVAKVKMKEVADAAALMGAQQLLMDASSATAERIQNVAQSQLGSFQNWNISASAELVNNNTGIQVTVTGTRPGIFRGIFPVGGWNISVTSTAAPEGNVPLCVLVTGKTAQSDGLGGNDSVVDLKDNSMVSAPQCMVYSDQDVKVEGAAQVNAASIAAVGEASGYMNPKPRNGATGISDPFSSIEVKVSSSCTDDNLSFTSGSNTLAPGVHCGSINVSGDATLTLQPGEHYFYNANLHMTGPQTTLQGEDVVLVFNANSQFQFDWNSNIELEGRHSGPLAGFLIVATRGNNNAFTIATTAARKLLGVVYVPNGVLEIQGQNRVAEDSAWTIIVSKGLWVSGWAELVLNTNYEGSAVPVPIGVGPSSKIGLAN